MRALLAMRRIGGTRLAVAHVTAQDSSNTGAAKIFGSTFFTNYARSTWEARAGEERLPDATQESERVVGLFHRKVNRGRLVRKPLTIGVCWQQDALRFVPATLTEDSDVAAHAPLSVQLREALRRGSSTTGELAELLGLGTDSDAHRLTNTLRRMPDVTRLDDQGPGRGQMATWGLSGVAQR